MRGSLGTAVGLGMVTGSRSMLAAAITAHAVAGRRRLPRSAGRAERWLARPMTWKVLAGLAAGELLADKMPGVPARVSPGPLTGRIAVGALLGAVAVDRDRRGAGALAGAAGALAGSFAGWFLRVEGSRATMLPDAALAIGEDAVALTAGRELAQQL